MQSNKDDLLKCPHDVTWPKDFPELKVGKLILSLATITV